MTKHAEVTYADPSLLEPARSTARYKFLIENHKALIKVMCDVSPQQHQQDVWARNEPRNVCGTSACALGWGAISNEIPGLQYYTYKEGGGTQYAPAINGGYVWPSNVEEYIDDIETLSHEDRARLGNGFWSYAGRAFFGETTSDEVFANPDLSTVQIINELTKRLVILVDALDSHTYQRAKE